MPDTITTIGAYAFSRCDGIVGALRLGSGVVTIGERAFFNSKNITSVTIPASVKYIGACAFVCRAGTEGLLNKSNLKYVKFEIAEGWYAYPSSNPGSGATGLLIDSAGLADTTLASEAVSMTYGDSYLMR